MYLRFFLIKKQEVIARAIEIATVDISTSDEIFFQKIVADDGKTLKRHRKKPTRFREGSSGNN